MKKLFLLSACAATIWLVQACSSASETTTADSVTTSANTLTDTAMPDSVFVKMTAMGGRAEVELGNIALANSTNTAVKDFANMMITDHTKANNELMAIAKNKNIILPDSLDAEHKAKGDSIRNLTGSAFDRAYAAMMVADHQKTLNLMQTEASGGLDANLKDFATKTTPVIQMHLEHAQRLQASIK
jgi:putative membrane protein